MQQSSRLPGVTAAAGLEWEDGDGLVVHSQHSAAPGSSVSRASKRHWAWAQPASIPATSTGCERGLLEKASHSLCKQSCASEGSDFSLCIPSGQALLENIHSGFALVDFPKAGGG